MSTPHSSLHPADVPAVSVVLCTYNRCDLLPTALQSLVEQATDGVRYEVIVVDNNSTDGTRDVVERFVREHDTDIRYLFEAKQGLSHARNAGIAAARADLVAFTDDDVTASRDWIAVIAAAFEDSDVACIGGKVLPQWPGTPPAWLVQKHWSPLALVDRGDDPIRADTQRPLVFVGANLVVRKRMFDVVGLFDAHLQRVKDGIGSTEDHEFLLRVYRSGARGRYVPALVVYAPVQVERMTRRYHRRWHTGHGRFMARMGLVPPDPRSPRLFGLPSYYYGGLVGHAVSWSKLILGGRREDAFDDELEIRSGIAFVRASRRLHTPDASVLGEVARFVRLLARKKWAGARSARS